MRRKEKPKIAILLGSKSDLERLGEVLNLLKEAGCLYRLEVISAHRSPYKLQNFCKHAKKEGIKIVIACAGLSAALPGIVASYLDIPVIGVPLDSGPLKGVESLFSIVEVPKGIGLVSTGIGKKGFINGIIFSLKILALFYKDYTKIVRRIEEKFKR